MTHVEISSPKPGTTCDRFVSTNLYFSKNSGILLCIFLSEIIFLPSTSPIMIWGTFFGFVDFGLSVNPNKYRSMSRSQRLCSYSYQILMRNPPSPKPSRRGPSSYATSPAVSLTIISAFILPVHLLPSQSLVLQIMLAHSQFDDGLNKVMLYGYVTVV